MYKSHFLNRLRKRNTFYCHNKFHLIRQKRFCPRRPTNCRIPRNLSLHKRNGILDRTCFVLSRSSKIRSDSMHKSIEVGNVARIVIGVSSYYQYPKLSTYLRVPSKTTKRIFPSAKLGGTPHPLTENHSAQKLGVPPLP